MLSNRRFRSVLALIAVLTAVFLVAGDVLARPSGGGSFGSRGLRTFSAPPTTQTAPKAAAPLQRTLTQPASPAANPVGAAARPAAGGLFGGSGFLGGLAAGFLGAGLIGLLMGNGLLGGLGGLASTLGLVLQIALVVIVARLAWAWWQRRNGLATAGGPSLRNMMPDSSINPGGTGGAGMMAAGPVSAGETIRIAKSDFDAFERLLSEVSEFFGKEDLMALRSRATPEMVSYFSEQLAKNASRGLVNEISDVKLLQGDLAEAWREGDLEYATVAMRYSLVDATLERASGRVVDGSQTPHEIIELWTFARSRDGEWILSAIQQG